MARAFVIQAHDHYGSHDALFLGRKKSFRIFGNSLVGMKTSSGGIVSAPGSHLVGVDPPLTRLVVPPTGVER